MKVETRVETGVEITKELLAKADRGDHLEDDEVVALFFWYTDLADKLMLLNGGG
tara:strand:- start:328 stop:489 length:162 start_codon:yes stop_codon:yes gene_type:complete